MRLRKVATVLAAVALGATGMIAASAGSAGALGNTIRVPQDFPTIQAAVNGATAPATTIIVSPGTYEESVLIARSGITIKGAPNQPQPIVSPPDDTESGCAEFFGSLDGFCIGSLSGIIKNVEIAGLTIQDFPGNGIIAFGADGLNFHDNTVLRNAEYGIARFDSSHTQIVHNWVVGSDEETGEAGIYNGDSPNSSSLIRQNHTENYEFGIFLRDSSHGTVTENTATGNCIGILLLDTDEPGGVADWTLVHNHADDNTKACFDEEGGNISGLGIAAFGATHSRLTANHATGNFPSGPTDFPPGGIVIIDGSLIGGAPSAFLQIDNNQLISNAPADDLFWDGVGPAISFHANSCAMSVPGGLC